MTPGVFWTTRPWLNLILAVPSALLLWRLTRTGGPGMLQMLDAPTGDGPHGRGCGPGRRSHA